MSLIVLSQFQKNYGGYHDNNNACLVCTLYDERKKNLHILFIYDFIIISIKASKQDHFVKKLNIIIMYICFKNSSIS